MATEPPQIIQVCDIKPVLSRYISDAHMMMDPLLVPSDKTVHDVRVLMKKSRATLKLIRTILGEKTFAKEYSTFRDVGRIMRSWRETSVHRKLLKNLRKKYPVVFKGLLDDVTINDLLSKKESSKNTVSGLKEDLNTISVLLHKSLYRLRFIKLSNPDSQIIFDELEKTYDDVTHCFLKARNYPVSANIHDFRKRVKDFLYQISFIRSTNPKIVKNIEKRLDSLGQNLGKYNDHSVLIAALDYKYKRGSGRDAIDNLILVMKQEQDSYLLKIWPSSYRIFQPGMKLADVLKLKVTPK
jgi:CHAD domain-containing protein